MPLQPLSIALTDGQKIETLKRFRGRYGDELKKLEEEMQDIMTHLAEAEFVAGYLGEQPEVAELRTRKADLEALERRRQHLGKIVDRLDQIIPQQPAVVPQPPNGTIERSGAQRGVKRY